MHTFLSTCFNAIRSTHRPSATSRRRRFAGLRLETLEGRDVPAPITTPFTGSLSDGGVDEYPFPPPVVNFTEIPSGSKIKVTFGASPDPSGEVKAKVELKNSKGAAVRSVTLGMADTKTIISYTVPQKMSVPWKVTVESVGKVGGNVPKR